MEKSLREENEIERVIIRTGGERGADGDRFGQKQRYRNNSSILSFKTII